MIYVGSMFRKTTRKLVNLLLLSNESSKNGKRRLLFILIDCRVNKTITPLGEG